MSKILALSGLVASALILIFMIVDLAVFHVSTASIVMNIGFIIGSLILGGMSFVMYRQAG
ncbi:MAG: hypothetical protein WD875_17125 [Pirellulales bacterium]